MLDWLLLGLVLISSCALTGILRRYAIKQNMLDVPNVRSSHSVPTPRGGGFSIVMTCLCATLLLFIIGRVPLDAFMALFGGGLLVAGIGFWDDHCHIQMYLRISVHFAAAAWALVWLGGFSPLPVGKIILDLGWFGHIICLVLLVWLLNLYNFMDGIDGIAGIEAVCIAGGAALILLNKGVVGVQPLLLGIVTASCAGFLAWNWPPARIFMGDVGSGFLGFILGIFAILTSASGDLSIWTWLILFGIFFVDATLTLLRRMIRGKRWYEAHRSHAYQHAVRLWASHSKVTLAILGINAVWLLPLAWYAAMRPGMGFALTGIAFCPLLVLALKLGAGKAETPAG